MFFTRSSGFFLLLSSLFGISFLLSDCSKSPDSAGAGSTDSPPTSCQKQGLYANLEEHIASSPLPILYDLWKTSGGFHSTFNRQLENFPSSSVQGYLQTGTLLSPSPQPQEEFSLWLYNSEASAFTLMGTGRADLEGRFALDFSGEVPPGYRRLYLRTRAGVCTLAGVFHLPPGTGIVITDIDGTLTLSEGEAISQFGDSLFIPKEQPDAPRLHQLYRKKGYLTVYLSARNDHYRHLTQTWLELKGFPFGPLITSGSHPLLGEPAREYKQAMVLKLKEEFGLEVIAAYGNQESDARAYLGAGIPPDRIFMLPPFSTEAQDLLGTTPLSSYVAHLAQVETLSPCSSCPSFPP